LPSLTNINISSSAWTESILPAAKGGLGIRSAIDSSLLSYLSSLHSTSELASSILTSSGLTFELSFLLTNGLPSILSHLGITDTFNYEHFLSLLDSAGLLSVSSSESGACLGALPVLSLDTKLDNDYLRIALHPRLGTSIVVEHTCVFGSKVDVFGTHDLSCRHSGVPRHATVNETIRCASMSRGIPAVLEPVGMCCDDGKRPDGMSLIPCSRAYPCCGT